MKIQGIIEELSKPENHWKRNLLKWVQHVAAGGTVGGLAASDPWSIGFSVVAFAISKVLEGKASATANDERLNRTDTEDYEEPPLKNKKPERLDYKGKGFYDKGKGTLSAIQKANRAAMGLPTAKELRKTEAKLKQVRYSYGVRVTIPGKPDKEFSCKSLTEANKLFKIEVASGKYPQGSSIEVTKTPKP